MTKQQDKKLLAIWRKKVLLIAKSRCEICKGTSHLNAHHYVGRRNRSTRYYIPNGVVLCAKHHTFGTQSAHQDPEWFRQKMIKKRGEDWMKDLVKQSNKIYKSTDYDKILKHLEQYE